MERWSAQRVAVGAAVLMGAAVAALFAWALQTQSYNVWGAIIVAPLIVLANVLIIRRVSQRNAEPWLVVILSLGLAAKVAGTLVRYLVAYVVYNGGADAQRYNLYAAQQYELWRQGFVVWEWAGKQGTQYMELITTAIYTVIGPTPLAGFLVFASFAFWGQYLLFRAFRIAVPEGDGRRYAILLLLLPSFLYWPSSIGKESWLLLFVGVTALGAAKFFRSLRGGIWLMALGALGTAIVRPHIAVMLFAAVLVAQLFRPAGSETTAILNKVGGVLVLAAAAYVLTTQSATFLGIDDLNWQKVSETVEWAGGQTQEGGSAFTPVPLTSPWGVVAAFVTVIFRPFPWEAHNAQLLVQSLEGLLLIILTVKAWPRLRRIPSILRHNPYVTMCVVYCSVFVVAFAGFGNFGILARQRVLMLPFFLVLLALPATDRVNEQANPDREFDDARR